MKLKIVKNDKLNDLLGCIELASRAYHNTQQWSEEGEVDNIDKSAEILDEYIQNLHNELTEKEQELEELKSQLFNCSNKALIGLEEVLKQLEDTLNNY